MDNENLKIHLPPPEKKNNFLGYLKSFTRQIIASAVILVVLFLLMNSSAYIQIFKSQYEKITGTETESKLTTLVDNTEIKTQIIVPPSVVPEIQKTQIPKLDFEIMPTIDRIVIPRIDKNVPIVRVSSQNLIDRDWKALEKDIQQALQNGVVHYPGTSLPGEGGNVVVTGHSSYFPWDPGNFKDVFALLHDVEIGDKVVVYYNQKKILYRVTEKFEVKPTNIDVLKQTEKERLTLITCTPVGTNLRRLIIVAEPIIETAETTEASKVLRTN